MPHQEQQGGQELRHISSHSDLGRKLPSLNSDVRGREKEGAKKRGGSDRQWDRQAGRETDTSDERSRMKGRQRLAQSDYSKCQNRDAVLIKQKMELSAPSRQIYDTTEAERIGLRWLSFLPFCLSLASGCDCIGLNDDSVLIAQLSED